jgi:hypothetical protein
MKVVRNSSARGIEGGAFSILNSSFSGRKVSLPHACKGIENREWKMALSQCLRVA